RVPWVGIVIAFASQALGWLMVALCSTPLVIRLAPAIDHWDAFEAGWLLLLALVLTVAFVYSGSLYARDARSVGWLWGLLLSGLRCTVYALLALVFLLPSAQTWNKTEQRYEVILLPDVSD